MNVRHARWLIAFVLALGSLLRASTFSAGGSSAAWIDVGDVGTGVLRTWGSNANGQLGHSPSTVRVPTPLPVSGTWKSVYYGASFAVAIDSSDNLWAWGANESGQLGNGTVLASSVPARVNLPVGSVVRSVALGQDFVIAIVDNGADTGRIFSWGANTLGQLGLGHQNVQRTPARQNHLTSSGTVRRYSQVTAGINAALAIASDGTLWGWGYNLNNVLGTAPSTNRTPIQIGSLNGWSEVAAGSVHVLARRGTQLFTWGGNNYGQLGLGTVGGVNSSPAQILSTQPIASIGVGDYHSFAITSSGVLYGWGWNLNGQLGLDNVSPQTTRTSPQIILPALAPWSTVDGGSMFTLARAGNTLYAFGENGSGQLGIGTIDTNVGISFNPTPQRPELTGVNLSVTSPALPGGVTALGANTTLGPVTVTVQNLGQANLSGNFTVSLYLSADPLLDAGDVLLATPRVESGPLDSLASRQVTFDSVLLPEVPFGTWYILSQVTTESAVDVFQPDNGNFVQISLAGPDLTLDLLALPSTQVPAGSALQVASLRLVNVGAGAVAPARDIVVEAFLSPTPTYSTGTALLLGQRSTVIDRDVLALTSREIEGVPTAPRVATAKFSTPHGYVTGQVVTLRGSSQIEYNGSFAITVTKPDEFEFAIPGTPLSPATVAITGTPIRCLASSVTFSAWNLSLPAAQPPGAYFLLFMANRSGAVAESGTAPNILAQPVTVTSYDLAVTTPTLAGGVLANNLGVNTTLSSVSTVLQNQGIQGYPVLGQVATARIELILSRDSTYEASDLVLASTPVSSQAGLTSRTITWNSVAIPDVAPGEYNLLARVNFGAGGADTLASNNVAATSITLKAPKLEIGDVRIDNTSVQTNGSFGNVHYLLRNLGPGSVAANREVEISVYLSTDEALSVESDVLLDRRFYSSATALDRGSSVTIPGRVLTVPQGITNGIYHLLFVTNANGNVPGAGAEVTKVQVAVGSLDALIRPIVLPVSGPIGVNTTIGAITIVVQNNGGFPIPEGLQVRLRISRDNQTGGGGTSLGDRLLTAIPARTSQDVRFDNVVIPNIGEGEHFIVAEIFLPVGLQDNDPSNNIASIGVTLERPDLIISSVTGIRSLDLDTGPFFLDDVKFVIENRSPAVILAGTELTYQIFLSRDGILDVSQDLKLVEDIYSGGLAPGASVEIGPIVVDPSRLADGTAIVPTGGTYELFVVVNRVSPIEAESRSDNNVLQTSVLLNRTNAPARGLDFVTFTTADPSEVAQWFVVSDSRATGGQAYQSPSLPPGQKATLSYRVTGPVTINAPWLLIPGSGDTLSIYVDGQILPDWPKSALQNSYRPNQIRIDDAVEREIEWVFQRGAGVNPNGYARVDIDVPAFSSPDSGEAAWITAPDSQVRPDGSPGTYSTTISGSNAGGLNQGEQVSLETTLIGPGVMTFWWRLDDAEASDRLSLAVNGQPYLFPTYTFNETPQVAAISGVSSWSKVAVLLRSGPQTIRWTYVQGSEQTGAQPRAKAYLSTMQLTTPVLEQNSPNYTMDSRFLAVPRGNVDFAITQGSAPAGTYLLDDAEGTGRLPVTITVQNLGYRFLASSAWDTTQLQMILSPNLTLGDADDVLLGDYAKLTSVLGENMVTFQAELNLPFDLAAGQYRVFARYGRSGDEFTLANNTLNLGTIQIERAPNLIVADLLSSPAMDFPWHPEDAVALTYRIENTGLGTVLPSQPFKIRVELVSFDCDSLERDFTVIKDYGETTLSVFLPEVRAANPNRSFTDVSAFVDLPTLRDVLVAIGAIPEGTPEDSRLIDREALEELRSLCFAFQFTVDSSNQITESSETNLFTADGLPFKIVAKDFLPTVIGSYFGDTAFGNLLVGASFLNGTTFAGNVDFRRFVQAYALGMALDSAANVAPVGSTQYGVLDSLLNPTGYANGYPSITIPPSSSEPRLTLTFEFNALAEDVTIEIKAGSRLDDSDSWPTILRLTPPYNQPTGPRSLTGFSGLKDQANVLAVDGNFTDVQNVWRPRVTVRDTEPLGAGGRFMRMVVSPLPNPPVPPLAPTGFAGAFTGEERSNVVLSWTVPAGQPSNVAYLLERSLFADRGYSALGYTLHFNRANVAGREVPIDGVYEFIDRSVKPLTTYYYRIRAMNVGGSTAYQGPVSVIVP